MKKCTYIIWLSEFFRAVSELTELVEWALTILKEMLAHLCLELLLEGIELTLVAIKVIIVTLLSQMSHHLAWWVIEVFLVAVGIKLSLLELWLGLGGAQASWLWLNTWNCGGSLLRGLRYTFWIW